MPVSGVVCEGIWLSGKTLDCQPRDCEFDSPSLQLKLLKGDMYWFFRSLYLFCLCYLFERKQIRYFNNISILRNSQFTMPSDINCQVNNKKNRIFIGCFCHNVGGQGQRTLQAPQMMQWAIRQREPPSFVARNPPAIPVTSTTNAAGWCIVPYVMR